MVCFHHVWSLSDTFKSSYRRNPIWTKHLLHRLHHPLAIFYIVYIVKPDDIVFSALSQFTIKFSYLSLLDTFRSSCRRNPIWMKYLLYLLHHRLVTFYIVHIVRPDDISSSTLSPFTIKFSYLSLHSSIQHLLHISKDSIFLAYFGNFHQISSIFHAS